MEYYGLNLWCICDFSDLLTQIKAMGRPIFIDYIYLYLFCIFYNSITYLSSLHFNY